MPAPNPLITLVREWFSKAENDLKNASLALAAGADCPTDTVCFHAQQCVEKYLEALLVFRAVPFPRTHKVEPTEPGTEPGPPVPTKTPIRVTGGMPAELWNRFGTRILPKLRSGEGLNITVDLSATFDGSASNDVKSDLRQVLRDLGLEGSFTIE